MHAFRYDAQARPDHCSAAKMDRLKARGRLLFMGIFVRGAWDLFREPTPRAEQARRIGLPVSDQFASWCGASMIAAALLLQIPPLRRPAAVLLALELPIFT